MVIVWRRRDRQLRRIITDAPDLSGQDFSRARLVALDLRHKCFRACNFEYADLTESDLSYADLFGANLHGAYLTGTILVGANLSSVRLDEATMMATDLRDAALANTTLVGTIWDQSTMWPAGYRPKPSEVGNWHGRKRS